MLVENRFLVFGFSLDQKSTFSTCWQHQPILNVPDPGQGLEPHLVPVVMPELGFKEGGGL
jgi:hypothetical protein